MYALFLTFCALVFAAVAALAFREWLADRWAAYEDGAREVVGFADVKALPDTDAFEPRAPLERRRLVSVPAQQPRHLRAVRDDAMTEDEWARLMAVVHSIPKQRKASD